MSKLYQKAIEAARTLDVQTPEDSVVVYSVSYLPSKENREKAFDYVTKNSGKMVIEYTDCGAKLVELGLSSSDSGFSDDEKADIWSIASKRFINSAKGEVVAFVKGADPRSVFCTQELPTILANPNITRINGEDKYKFAEKFKS